MGSQAHSAWGFQHALGRAGPGEGAARASCGGLGAGGGTAWLSHTGTEAGCRALALGTGFRATTVQRGPETDRGRLWGPTPPRADRGPSGHGVDWPCPASRELTPVSRPRCIPVDTSLSSRAGDSAQVCPRLASSTTVALRRDSWVSAGLLSQGVLPSPALGGGWHQGTPIPAPQDPDGCPWSLLPGCLRGKRVSTPLLRKAKGPVPCTQVWGQGPSAEPSASPYEVAPVPATYRLFPQGAT